MWINTSVSDPKSIEFNLGTYLVLFNILNPFYYFLGYSYVGMNVVAIARLRGQGLQELLISEDCLESEEPSEHLTEEDVTVLSEVNLLLYII